MKQWKSRHNSMTYYAFLFCILISSFFIFFSCSSNNCPLESTVTCNYGFYDTNGTPVSYNDTLTITTLLAGTKTQYTYQLFGHRTITSDVRIDSLLEQGYTETISEVRRDTILGNKLYGLATMKVPMGYFNTCDTIIIRYASISNRDTLYIQHVGYSNVDLPECGTHRFHTLTGIRATDAGIDHVEIANPTVNYTGNENIRIYFNGIAEEEE